MIGRLIDLCAKNRWFVIFALSSRSPSARPRPRAGCRSTPFPDLSDPQVIVFTEWKGRSPTLIEDQVTYPDRELAPRGAEGHRRARLLDVRHVVRLRPLRRGHRRLLGALARARVHERASRASCPRACRPCSARTRPASAGSTSTRSSIGPGKHDLAELRTLQDFTLRYALESVPGVAQVASVGGYERQYQVTLDPDKLRAFGLTVDDVARRDPQLQRRGRRARARDERTRVLRARARLPAEPRRSRRAWRSAPAPTGRRVRVGDVGTVRFGGDIRRGLAELDGKGETVGAIVIARYGENALDVIERVQAKLDELKTRAARRGRDRSHLRSLVAHRARDRDAQARAHRGGHHRQPGHPPLPAPLPERAPADHQPAHRGRCSRSSRCTSSASPRRS